MSGWLYLIRNRDLYKIGITKNFDSRMRQLKPDKVVAKLYTRDFLKLERELHNRYQKFRIPQTEYFRLEDYHLNEIKQRISKLEYTLSMILQIFIKSFLFIILLFFLLFLLIYLNINELNIILLKTILWMERITFAFSVFSLFVHSGMYLSIFSEIKYRISTSIVFIVFSFLFRISSFLLR